MSAASLEVLRRELASYRISLLENTPVEITRADILGGASHTCRVLALSPLGLRVHLPEATAIDRSWLGRSVQATISYSDTQIVTHRGVVVDVASDSEPAAMAIRIVAEPASRIVHLERRRQVRWLCSDDFRPTGVASNPAKFNDFVLFRVFDISRSGMRLVTSLRNNFIVRGMRLDIIVSFPMVSQITVRTTVQNVSFVSSNEKEYLSVGVHFERMTLNQSSVIAQYMAQFGDVDSLREFRDGYGPVGIGGSIEFGVVRTEEDYREVLNLRHLAYMADGKISDDLTASEVSDIHDSRARILTCKYRGKTIATARLTFHEHGDVTEHEAFIVWPNEFPRRDESVEVTRACTHPDFRRTGLFFALLRHVVITATQAGRSWVVTSSTEDLVPMYQFVGLFDVGLTYHHPELNDLKHIVLVGNMHDALSGRTVGPTAWNQVWRDALPYTSFPNSAAQDTLSRIRIAAYRLVGPLLANLTSAILWLKR